MCFRPVALEKQIECPECGGKYGPLNGFMPPKCPFCGNPTPMDDDDDDE